MYSTYLSLIWYHSVPIGQLLEAQNSKSASERMFCKSLNSTWIWLNNELRFCKMHVSRSNRMSGIICFSVFGRFLEWFERKEDRKNLDRSCHDKEAFIETFLLVQRWHLKVKYKKSILFLLFMFFFLVLFLDINFILFCFISFCF